MTNNQHIPEHVSFEHAIILDAPINKVFKLFTPRGEQKWDRDWNPRFIYPEDGSAIEDAVFTTQTDDRETIWMIKLYMTYKHHITYYRITPEVVAGVVDVKCRPYGEQTQAKIKYSFTMLTEEGKDFIAEWTTESFVRYIDSWQRSINHFLRTGEAKD